MTSDSWSNSEMKVPLSWLKDYVDIDLSLIEVAETLTMAGLEVEDVLLVGLPNPYEQPGAPLRREVSIHGLTWDPDKIVVAKIEEVMPHPNADRLVLCRLNDGSGELVVLTGAPYLFEFKGKGLLAKPIKVAYAREGSRLYDGHQPGWELTTLKRSKIRGVDSFSMVCSEKELGISEEHEGIIILDDDAPTGMPLVDYMGDAVLEANILPNMIRNASLVGIAREVAALTKKTLRKPQAALPASGPSMQGKAAIEITDPKLNPRFVLGMLEGAEQRPSPYRVQLRLRLAGMRPINAVVDATNYVMLELGQPLHAFDYDVLVRRAGGKAPTIITRAARSGETLTTLDGVERQLDDFTVLVCDTAGPLSLAGVMGGLESEISPSTRTILLEGATWNYVNTRRTTISQHLVSEAGFRFSRGGHPALSSGGVVLCLQRMAEWSGGTVYGSLVDNYPLPADDPEVDLTPAEVKRLLGVSLSPETIAELLSRLEFACRVEGDTVYAKTPPHRLDIGTGVVGRADLVEEVARIYGYDRIPSTYLAEELPDARDTRAIKVEQQVREILVRLGLQEVVNYRLTSPEREARLADPQGNAEQPAYLAVKNPLSPERSVMRRSLLASVLDSLEKNARLRDRLTLFEIGPVFIPVEGAALPEEQQHVAIVMTGRRDVPAWDKPAAEQLDFYDLKGVLGERAEGLHLGKVGFKLAAQAAFHPGKTAQVLVDGKTLGFFGELHPQIQARYDFLAPAVLAADLNLAALIEAAQPTFEVRPVPVFPPVFEDLALIVDESVPAVEVENAIRQGGGKLLTEVRLFDIFRGEQIGAGKKSLAYALSYQAPDHTLSPEEAGQIRQRIIRRAGQVVGAELRK